MERTHRVAVTAALGLVLGFCTLADRAAAEELEIGAPGPAFSLRGTDGKMHALSDFDGDQKKKKTAAQAVALVFTCNHCPYAKAYEPVLIDLAKQYEKRGIAFVLINPNDPKVQPQDSFEKMQERALEKKYPFPYLFDATQEVAKAYGALVTPHVFLLDSKRELAYRGRISDSHHPEKVETHDLVNAFEALLENKKIDVGSTKAFGCSIKWSRGT